MHLNNEMMLLLSFIFALIILIIDKYSINSKTLGSILVELA